jgi:hypothetical protein
MMPVNPAGVQVRTGDVSNLDARATDPNETPEGVGTTPAPSPAALDLEVSGTESIVVTYDLYGHLIPGSMDEDRAKFDAFLDRSDTAARIRAATDTDAV